MSTPTPAARGWRAALRHAFAVDAPGPAEPTDEERPIVERICRMVARPGMAMPAAMLLEMSRPLNAVGAAGLRMLHPAFWALAGPSQVGSYERFTAYLERRGSLEWMANRIEALAQEADSGPQPPGPSPQAEGAAKTCKLDLPAADSRSAGPADAGPSGHG
ncbi:MAG TPA: hypothetical protein PKC43_13955 [Phycisphaerales bacterium]|nr:hypothetical protein [Phycisphaerales bacterium]HMP38538.1 hypothetical protein [Phycisphaerales bacterium]